MNAVMTRDIFIIFSWCYLFILAYLIRWKLVLLFSFFLTPALLYVKKQHIKKIFLFALIFVAVVGSDRIFSYCSTSQKVKGLL